MKVYWKRWADKNRDHLSNNRRKYQLQSQYGLTEEDYQVILTSQEGCCAICGTDTPTGKWKVFAVDHNHTTDQVRGLLCNECNRGMGLLRDNAELLRKAADYLDHHDKKTATERKVRCKV
jgi:hypothetical protein